MGYLFSPLFSLRDTFFGGWFIKNVSCLPKRFFTSVSFFELTDGAIV